MMDKKISVLGSGKMARVLVTALIDKGYNSNKLWVSGRNVEKLTYFKEELKVNTTTSNQEAIEVADIIILSVKPKDLPILCLEINKYMTNRAQDNPSIVSIAAGINIERLQQWLGSHVDIIRAMPNIPVIVHAGATALYCHSNIDSARLDAIETIFRSMGLVVMLKNESQLDIATAISGSGPAYYFLLTETLENVAVQLGLDKDSARLLTLQTAFGAASLALKSELTVQELKESVTTSKGTTEAALNVMTQKGFSIIIRQALEAAIQRANEMNKAHLTEDSK